MSKRYIAIASALAFSLLSHAQNLNPTVQVTNAYDNRLMDISKHSLQMAVPDSLLRFDWDFNYSVFDNPYKGAYEFNPYIIDIKPEASAYDGKRLLLSAGVGYTIHPEARLYWNPVLKKRLKLAVYDEYGGYWGPYSGISWESSYGGNYSFKKDGSYTGYDLTNILGTSLRYDAKSSVLSLDARASYLASAGEGLFHYLMRGHSAFSADAVLGLKSNAPESPFDYDLSVSGSSLLDHMSWDDKASELSLAASAKAGFALAGRQKLGMSADVSGMKYIEQSGSSSRSFGIGVISMNFTPSYTFKTDRFEVTGGATLSKVIQSADYERVVPEGKEAFKPRLFYPYAHLSLEMIEDALVLFADIRGGQRFNSYSSYLNADHWFDNYGSGMFLDGLADVTMTSYDASLGFSGRIGHRLQFKLDGGYAKLKNAPMEGVQLVSEGKFMHCYEMTDYNLAYADINAAWGSERFDLKLDANLRKAFFNEYSNAAGLPLVSGSFDMKYNWNRRVFAGLSLDWASGRTATHRMLDGLPEGAEKSLDYECFIPAWADLGLSAEYRFKKLFSLWVKGGNLLNSDVRRNLMVAETKPYFTLGICLNL